MKILSNIAQTIKASDVGIPNGTPDQIWVILLNLAYFVSGIIAVIIIIVAGFKIMTASDQAKLVKAKDSINHAIIAIVVILSAFTLTQYFVGSF